MRLPGERDEGEVLQVLPACATPAGDGLSQPAHLTLGDAGTRLHVGVRGRDVLATFAVARGTDGVTLTHLADTSCGQWPRHHAVLPGGTASADVVVRRGAGQPRAGRARDRCGRLGARELSRLTLPVRPSCVVPV